MSTLSKLMIAATAALLLAGPVAAFETPTNAVTPAETCAGWAADEGECALRAAQPTKFCFAESKCTTGSPVRVEELVRFDAAMDAALAE